MSEQSKKSAIIKVLESIAVKAALKKLLGTAAMGGIKGWLIKLIAEELFEHIAEPVIRLIIRKGQLVYDKAEGSLKLRKIRKAKNEGDSDTYWDTISDI